MCKFIGKSNERILCKLSKSEILRLYSIVHVAMETTKTSNFTCQSKSYISIFFTCQVSAWELQPFSCHDLANDLYSQTAKTVFSHLKIARIVSQFKTRTIAYSTLQKRFAKIGHSTHIYMHLVFTKSVDSNFRAFWLAPVTRNILGYPLFWDGIQNGFSFRDSFERWNFSGKWNSCTNKYQETDKIWLVRLYWSIEKKTFSLNLLQKSFKMIPETLSIET